MRLRIALLDALIWRSFDAASSTLQLQRLHPGR
jgi:hypothetical protein